MAKSDWQVELIKQLPIKKLRRYELTNLLFELIGCCFILHYSEHVQNPIYGVILWFAAIGSGLFCLMWACKQ
jgi:hypothetical protein